MCKVNKLKHTMNIVAEWEKSKEMGELCHDHNSILEIVGWMKRRIVNGKIRMVRVILRKIWMRLMNYSCAGDMCNHQFGG